MPLLAEYLVDDAASLAALFPPTHDRAVRKCIDHLDRHARDFIARSPFLCIGTQSGSGTADVSPRGDPAGFVQVLNDTTLVIPDRPGNNRLDTLKNIVAHPAVGLLFLIPGFEETLRVNGHARITRDPAVLAPLAINDRLPTVAIVVTVHEVFLHCAKALRRSHLWDADRHQDRRAMPSLVAMILDQTATPPVDAAALAQMDADLEDAYQRTMY